MDPVRGTFASASGMRRGGAQESSSGLVGAGPEGDCAFELQNGPNPLDRQPSWHRIIIVIAFLRFSPSRADQPDVVAGTRNTATPKPASNELAAVSLGRFRLRRSPGIRRVQASATGVSPMPTWRPQKKMIRWIGFPRQSCGAPGAATGAAQPTARLPANRPAPRRTGRELTPPIEA